jgi:Ca-activated chloride channel homolog
MIHFTVFGQPAGIERPIGLLMAVAVLAFAAFQAVRTLHRRGIVRPWVTPGREAQLASGHSPPARATRLALFGLGSALLAVAWAGPLYGEAEQKLSRRGIDLVIALDASRSMLAGDVTPNRLTAARVAVEELLGKLGGDRVGVVAFAQDAFVQAPLTTDYDAARLYLRAVDPLQMQQGGTAIARALEQAGAMFQRAEQGQRDRAVLVVSDGEDWSKGAADEAKRLADSGVHVYTLGVGTLVGAPVPRIDRRGQLVGYEQNANGEVVVTRPNPAALAEIAKAGNGEAFFTAGLVNADPIAQRIAQLQKGEVGTTVRRASIDRYQWFALPGALLLALALALGEERKARAIKVAAALLAIGIAPSAMAQGILQSPEKNVREGIAAYEKGDYSAAEKAFEQAEAKSPANAIASFNRGTALLKAGKAQESLAAFEKARSPELQGRDAYNRGLSLATLEKKDEAIASFRSSLEADPSNEDARHNLEVLLAKKKEEDEKKKNEEQQKQDPKPEDKQEAKPEEKPGEADQKKEEQPGEGDKEPKPAPGEPAGEPPPKPRSEAERVLDQLKHGERLLPVGKPTQKPRKEIDNDHPW